MIEKTEADIIQYWKTRQPVLVSIICVTYNQKLYIKNAIESFLMQETDFPFEIIIQDDASTDGTREIIEKYQRNYPGIIKTIFHTENQFSKNYKNVLLTAIPYLRGDYIAICDGDDYWIDCKKLQIQLTAMQEYPNCHISFHPGICRFSDEKKPDKVMTQYSKHNKIFTPAEIILGGGGFCLTPSLMIKNKLLQLPDWFKEVKAGDYFLQMLSSLSGGALYINKIMAVYRAHTASSWTKKLSEDADYFYDFYTTLLQSLDHMNDYTQYYYQAELFYAKKKMAFYLCRNVVFSENRRKDLFNQYKFLFNYKDKIAWHLIFKNKKIYSIFYQFKKYLR